MTLSACSVYLDLKIEKSLTCTLFLHSAGGQVGEEAADPGLGIDPSEGTCGVTGSRSRVTSSKRSSRTFQQIVSV